MPILSGRVTGQRYPVPKDIFDFVASSGCHEIIIPKAAYEALVTEFGSDLIYRHPNDGEIAPLVQGIAILWRRDGI